MQYDDDDRPAKGKNTVVVSVFCSQTVTLFPPYLGSKTAETPLNYDKQLKN